MTSPTPAADLPAILTQVERLPSLPAVAVEVLRLTRDEESTIEDLARAISRDPVLSAKLLKLSNSSLFRHGCEVSTLPRAVMLLGMKTVKLMSLSFSLVGSLPREGTGESFDYELFWRRSLVAAVASRHLARRTGGREDEAFLCGLLKSIGKLVLARCMPEEYDGVLARRGKWPELAAEREELGFDSAQVGSALLRAWELPAIVHLAVGCQENPDSVPDDAERDISLLTRVLRYAGLVEDFLLRDERGAALEALEEVGKTFALSRSDVEQILISLEGEMQETAEMLSVAAPVARTHEDLIEEARHQIVSVSLGTALDLDRAERRTHELEEEKRALESLAMTDALTGLPNRAAFDDFLFGQVHARIEHDVPRSLGLLMLDVDRFKSFNDTYGHAVGDEVLRMVGGVLLRMTRKSDLAARYGGEEFAVVVPSATPFGLRSLAERLRRGVAEEVLEQDGRRLSVSVSIGGAWLGRARSQKDARALVELADRYLYRAKQAGRNRCELPTTDPPLG